MSADLHTHEIQDLRNQFCKSVLRAQDTLDLGGWAGTGLRGDSDREAGECDVTDYTLESASGQKCW